MITAVGLATGLVGLGLGGCARSAESAPQPIAELVVLTPHNAEIRYAFAAGFSRWYFERFQQSVHVKWVYRGTPQCVDYVIEAANAGPRDRSVERPDVFFGGGILDHTTVKEAGVSRAVEMAGIAAELPAEVNGLPTRDPGGYWYATGLSSFGILYNEAALDARGIAPPTTWADLADPRFFGWVAVADPNASGSHRQCLALIMEHEGLPGGWSTVTRILGNTRALSPRSGMALDLVQYGQALATFCVNFDGAARVEESGGRLAYVDPPDATALTPDLISALTTGAEPDLAEAFITFVLSPQGQELWALEQQARVSPGATLYHYPIDPQLFTEPRYEGKLSVTRNPFETDFGLQVDPAKLRATGQLVELLVSAAAPAHVQLQQAWERIIAAGTPPEAVAQLGELPAAPEALRAVVMPAVAATDEVLPDNPTAAWVAQLPANWHAAAEAADGG